MYNIFVLNIVLIPKGNKTLLIVLVYSFVLKLTNKVGYSTQEKKRNQIHMILGGPAGGDSNRARKLHLRELNEITYEIKELEGMDTGPVLVF